MKKFFTANLIPKGVSRNQTIGGDSIFDLWDKMNTLNYIKLLFDRAGLTAKNKYDLSIKCSHIILDKYGELEFAQDDVYDYYEKLSMSTKRKGDMKELNVLSYVVQRIYRQHLKDYPDKLQIHSIAVLTTIGKSIELNDPFLCAEAMFMLVNLIYALPGSSELVTELKAVIFDWINRN